MMRFHSFTHDKHNRYSPAGVWAPVTARRARLARYDANNYNGNRHSCLLKPCHEGGAARAWVTGFLTNLLNPKAMLYFGSVLSQALSPGSMRRDWRWSGR